MDTHTQYFMWFECAKPQQRTDLLEKEIDGSEKKKIVSRLKVFHEQMMLLVQTKPMVSIPNNFFINYSIKKTKLLCIFVVLVVTVVSYCWTNYGLCCGNNLLSQSALDFLFSFFHGWNYSFESVGFLSLLMGMGCDLMRTLDTWICEMWLMGVVMYFKRSLWW